jgi:hypothetical protein
MSVVRRHPLVGFFVLAYLLSWGALPWDSFFAPGPLLAALIVVSATQGVPGLRLLGLRLVRWRVGWIWYVLAVGVPLAVLAATTGTNLALGASASSLSRPALWYGIPVAIGLHALNPVDGPFSEEPSFRGYAQVALQARRSRLKATAIMAVLVTGWHGPLFVMSWSGLRPFEAISTVAVTFWYAWLFNHAGGSSLITLIAHGTEGSVRLGLTGADAARQAWIYLVVWSVVALALLIGDRRWWVGGSSDPVAGRGSARAQRPRAGAHRRSVAAPPAREDEQ